jgi:hypothetical protein
MSHPTASLSAYLPSATRADHWTSWVADGTAGTVLLALVFRACLDVAYYTLIRDVFGEVFSESVLGTPSLVDLTESYLLTAVTAIPIARMRRAAPSSVTFVVLQIFLITPLLSMFGSGSPLAPRSFIYACVAGFLVAVATTRWVPGIRLRRPDRALTLIAVAAAIVLTVYVYGVLLVRGGLSRFNLDLYRVYEIRELVELDEATVPFLAYLLPWQAHVVNVAALGYGILKRSWLAVAAVVLLQVLLFGMTNYKSFLMAPLLVVGLYVAASSRWFFRLALGGACATVLLSQTAYLLTNNLLIPSLFVRRIFFGVANNHLLYYHYFSHPQHPFVLLSHSILSPLLSYPYPRPVTALIAAEYMGGQGSPNVGYLGDAYFNFGIPGMLVFSAALGIFLRALDGIARRVSLPLASAVVAIPALSLVASGLLTSLLTHGFLAAAAALWFLGGWYSRYQEEQVARIA